MHRILSFCVIGAATLLVGCADQNEDIKQRMETAKAGMNRNVTPIEKVKPYDPLSYDAATLIEPFNALKAKIEGDRSGASLPEQNRPRQPLEDFPLESLKLVGIFHGKSGTFAQILANGRGHQVQVGHYLGQNFGKIIKIETKKNEERIVIREVIRDADGKDEEKETELLLDSRGVK